MENANSEMVRIDLEDGDEILVVRRDHLERIPWFRARMAARGGDVAHVAPDRDIVAADALRVIVASFEIEVARDVEAAIRGVREVEAEALWRACDFLNLPRFLVDLHARVTPRNCRRYLRFAARAGLAPLAARCLMMAAAGGAIAAEVADYFDEAVIVERMRGLWC